MVDHTRGKPDGTISASGRRSTARRVRLPPAECVGCDSSDGSDPSCVRKVLHVRKGAGSAPFSTTKPFSNMKSWPSEPDLWHDILNVPGRKTARNANEPTRAATEPALTASDAQPQSQYSPKATLASVPRLDERRRSSPSAHLDRTGNSPNGRPCRP